MKNKTNAKIEKLRNELKSLANMMTCRPVVQRMNDIRYNLELLTGFSAIEVACIYG